jgi:hypothetical protein
MEVVAPHPPSARATARHRLPPPKRVWGRRRRRAHERVLTVPEASRRGGDEGSIDGAVLRDRWRGHAWGAPRTRADQRPAAPQPVARGTPRGRRRLGRRQHAAPPEHRQFLGVEPGRRGCATVARRHGRSVPQPTRQTVVDAQVGPPGPGHQTGHGPHALLARRRKSLEKDGGGRGHRPGEPDLTVAVDETDVQRPGRQIDAPGGFMSVGVASQGPSSSSPPAVCVMSIPDGEVEEEVSRIIKAS